DPPRLHGGHDAGERLVLRALPSHGGDARTGSRAGPELRSVHRNGAAPENVHAARHSLRAGDAGATGTDRTSGMLGQLLRDGPMGVPDAKPGGRTVGPVPPQLPSSRFPSHHGTGSSWLTSSRPWSR